MLKIIARPLKRNDTQGELMKEFIQQVGGVFVRTLETIIYLECVTNDFT
jgi:hypothetical protein